MITNNYIKLLNRVIGVHSNIVFVNCDGAEKTSHNYGPDQYAAFGFSMPNGRCNAFIASASGSRENTGVNPGVYFGSGNTPPTREDYTLAEPITSGLEVYSVGKCAITDENGNEQAATNGFLLQDYQLTSVYVVKNTTDAEITIRELGLFCPLYVGTGYWSGTGTWGLALMERTVLSSPITIPPGESKLVTYKIDVNFTL